MKITIGNGIDKIIFGMSQEDVKKGRVLSYEGLVEILELNYPSAECEDVRMFN